MAEDWEINKKENITLPCNTKAIEIIIYVLHEEWHQANNSTITRSLLQSFTLIPSGGLCSFTWRCHGRSNLCATWRMEHIVIHLFMLEKLWLKVYLKGQRYVLLLTNVCLVGNMHRYSGKDRAKQNISKIIKNRLPQVFLYIIYR